MHIYATASVYGSDMLGWFTSGHSSCVQLFLESARLDCTPHVYLMCVSHLLGFRVLWFTVYVTCTYLPLHDLYRFVDKMYSTHPVAVEFHTHLATARYT